MEQLEYYLVMVPHNRPSVNVPLHTDIGEVLTVNDVSEVSSMVYSDLTYIMNIKGIDMNLVDQIQFYVNGGMVDCIMRDSDICFPSKNGYGEQRIFLDCYGFVEISIALDLKTGEKLHFCTGEINVLVHKGALNDSVRAMVGYVYSHQEELLLSGEAKVKDYADLKEAGRKGIESQILLANEIATIYESNYGYFKANCRFKMCSREMVDNFEKLQQVYPATLRYIAQHPEQLHQVVGIEGIRSGYRIYQPNKTLVTQNVYSTDIYENQVIVSFLKQMIQDMMELSDKLDQVIRKFPIKAENKDEYVYSSYFIFANTKKTLKEDRDAVVGLIQRYKVLSNSYQHILQTSEVNLSYPPKPTAIFLSVPQYNRIFIRIQQWYTYGIYDLCKEKFLLSFIKVSLLYETYLLVKFIQFFKQQGMELVESKLCNYPTNERCKYQNTKCNNTFVFLGNQQNITLYYQPVVFDSDRSSVNQIGLYRNNTISIVEDDEVERKGHYYVPDFIIKVDQDGVSRYLLCDAKFSTTDNVRNRHLPRLVYKYLFSLSPISDSNIISGLCVINGQELSGCHLDTVYNKQLEEYQIKPLAEILSLAEDIENEKHFECIKRLLQLIK